jgi:hypothetical protein
MAQVSGLEERQLDAGPGIGISRPPNLESETESANRRWVIRLERFGNVDETPL